MKQKPDIKRLKKIISNFQNSRILVIGDMMLDHFVRGKVNRISPEAPVPIVHVTHESMMPGGAANVAMNLRSMGVNTGMVGAVGKDINGQSLKMILRKAGVNTRGVVTLENIQTTKKTRIIAHSQQIVRFDYETPAEISGDDETLVNSRIKNMVPEYNAVIVEDYGKGLITQSVINQVSSVCRKNGIFSAFDPKPGHDMNFSGIDLCTPNLTEAEHYAKMLKKNIGSLPGCGEHLRKELGLNLLLITLGEDGMALFSEGHKASIIPAMAREVFDVSGAGDTVISAFTAAIVAGAKPFEAAYIANIAAGIVVGKLGTATASPHEILKALDEKNN